MTSRNYERALVPVLGAFQDDSDIIRHTLEQDACVQSIGIEELEARVLAEVSSVLGDSAATRHGLLARLPKSESERRELLIDLAAFVRALDAQGLSESFRSRLQAD